LVGSLHHTSLLSEAEADKIRFYFNYDMIGSPKPGWYIYKDPNDPIGAQKLLDYIQKTQKSAKFG
jgi:aminopeptidase Y